MESITALGDNRLMIATRWTVEYGFACDILGTCTRVQWIYSLPSLSASSHLMTCLKRCELQTNFLQYSCRHIVCLLLIPSLCLPVCLSRLSLRWAIIIAVVDRPIAGWPKGHRASTTCTNVLWNILACPFHWVLLNAMDCGGFCNDGFFSKEKNKWGMQVAVRCWLSVYW